jgi:hypothetical protein
MRVVGGLKLTVGGESHRMRDTDDEKMKLLFRGNCA